jgi:hypothetical protein
MVTVNWFANPRIGVAWQFYHLARILLKLYHSDRPRDMDVFSFHQHLEVSPPREALLTKPRELY